MCDVHRVSGEALPAAGHERRARQVLPTKPHKYRGIEVARQCLHLRPHRWWYRAEACLTLQGCEVGLCAPARIARSLQQDGLVVTGREEEISAPVMSWFFGVSMRILRESHRAHNVQSHGLQVVRVVAIGIHRHVGVHTFEHHYTRQSDTIAICNTSMRTSAHSKRKAIVPSVRRMYLVPVSTDWPACCTS